MKNTLPRYALLLLLSLIIVRPPALALETLLVDDFENGLNPAWTSKSFQGDTLYSIVSSNGGKVLQATSNSSASGLIFEREIDVHKYPILTWRWRVENVLEQGDARNKATDDYAARIYVTFPHWYFPKTTSLTYIWANRLPKGNSIHSPYTANSMMFAVESGKERTGQWVSLQRNLVEDYRQAFGKEPPKTAILAIMTDTDNTGGKARAWYDDIILRSE